MPVDPFDEDIQFIKKERIHQTFGKMITTGVRDFQNQDLFFPTNGFGRSISTHYIYEGGYLQKKHHGFGRLIQFLEDGQHFIYEGQWQHGKYHGHGKFISSYGSI